MILRILTVLLFLNESALPAQESLSNKKIIAFYNVENLFAPSVAAEEDDQEYHYDKPSWDHLKYRKKISDLSQVIRGLGNNYLLEGPDIIGLAEIQNAAVLRDLITHNTLADLNYDFIHFDSPDHRGIDVALLFKKSSFIPIHAQSHHLFLRDHEGYPIRSRDILVVSGYFGHEIIHLLVNHWPSRRGGALKSGVLRRGAALLNRRIIDSLQYKYSNPFILTMGDFNDDPTDSSMFYILGGRQSNKGIEEHYLFNPMLTLFRQGYGSLAYRDRWHLFDQILINRKVITPSASGFEYVKAGIFMPPWLKVSGGRYKGYPLRTYVGNSYKGGYSDHFPVYILLKRNTPLSGEPDLVRNPQ